jgi:Tfp pilus assembly major pilin PilA
MNKSFTLIEVLVVVLTVGILSSIIYVASESARERGNFAKVLMFSEKIKSSLAENMVGQWGLDEGTGENIYDSSMNNNNGTRVGSVAWETNKKNCVYNYCMYFDGVDDYINIAKDLTGGLNSITLSVWAKNENGSSNLFISSGNAIILHFRGAGFYLVGEDGTTSGYLGWGSTLPLNKWLHLVATWSNSSVGDGKMKLYIDSVKQSSELSFTGGATNKLRISTYSYVGHYFNSGQVWFKGYVDEINLYNKALTTTEIKEKYYSGLNNLLVNNQIGQKEYLSSLFNIKLTTNE